MKLSEVIDALIEPFAPRAVHSRIAWRRANDVVRQYDAATHDRRTQGWRRSGSSANVEVRRGMVGLRNGASELVRNNKTAHTAIRQLTAHIIGDGIATMARHSDPAVQKAAQEALDEVADSEIDGRNDWYGTQKLACWAWLERGDSLLVWSSTPDGYNDQCRVFEGDYIDHQKNGTTSDGGEIIQGVQFDKRGIRTGYWLFDTHPGDSGSYAASKFWKADNIDHVFEQLRPGQARGVSILASVMMDLKDLGDLKDAIMIKKKVEACLALILTPGEGNPNAGPFDTPQENPDGGPQIETLRPGMIMRTKSGDTVNTVNPSSSGDGVEFITKELAGIGAVTVPYHILTGDVSQANYSSLRAAMLAFWTLLDDWQNNVIVPFVCKPFFKRRMKALYMATGDRRFLQVKAEYAMPVRRFVDPIKDVAGEVAEVRAGFKLQTKSLSERGTSAEAFAAAKKAENEIFDAAGLVLDTDPRRVTDSGILQAAAGYIAPTGSKPANPQPAK